MSRLSLFVAFSSVLALGCGSDSDEESGVELYSGAASIALGDPANQTSCATCHTADGTVGGSSGASFKDIAFRTGFKGGDAPSLLAGANACVAGWMGGTPLTEDDGRWIKLERYLVSISNPAVTTPNSLAPKVLANEAAYESTYAGGNASNGAAKYATFCGRCHDGGLRVGAVGAPTLATIKVLSIGRIAQQVRTSGPPPSGMSDPSDSTPGPMPFFEPDELTAQELRDIVAHIRM